MIVVIMHRKHLTKSQQRRAGGKAITPKGASATVSAHTTVAVILPEGSARGTGVLHHSSPTWLQTLRLERLGEYGNPEQKGRTASAAGAEDMLSSSTVVRDLREASTRL